MMSSPFQGPQSFTEITVSHNPHYSGNVFMTPVERANRLISDQPDLAELLLCFLVWATESKGDPEHEAELEAVEEFLYSKTEHSRAHREAHRRLLVKELSAVSPLTSTGP